MVCVEEINCLHTGLEIPHKTNNNTTKQNKQQSFLIATLSRNDLDRQEKTTYCKSPALSLSPESFVCVSQSKVNDSLSCTLIDAVVLHIACHRYVPKYSGCGWSSTQVIVALQFIQSMSTYFSQNCASKAIGRGSGDTREINQTI